MASEGLPPLLSRVLDPLSRYHDHRVEGIEHVPVLGPALLVIHHSLATYDGLLLAMAVWHQRGRMVAGLAHDRLFEVPGFARLAERLDVRRASPEAGRELLAQGHVVMVAPGGMWEALRPSTERYQVRWDNRKGFVRLALEAQVPLVLAACPRADDLFDVESHPLTEWVYDTFRLPLPMVKGRRGWPIPRPVSLVHHLSAPLHPPPYDAEREASQVDELHERAVATMRNLLGRR
ncbi:MAG: lysophospholipid acyltransferase family protein [Myxococcota bacterium]